LCQVIAKSKKRANILSACNLWLHLKNEGMYCYAILPARPAKPCDTIYNGGKAPIPPSNISE